MAFALFRTESYQRINRPIRTNTQRFCLARAVHYQPAPHHPGTRQEPKDATGRCAASRRLVPADRFCRAFDEIRNFLRPTSYINQKVSLARRRVTHVQRVAALRDLISAV